MIALIFIVVALAVYILASLWISTNHIVIREYTADTGKSAEGFRAVVISDLHDHRFGGDNEELAEKIRDTDPDIIIMDGDILNAESGDSSVPLELIGLLRDTAPIYYALGNHEISYMENGHSDLREELESAGAVVLDKNYVDIDSFIFGDASKGWDVDLVISGHNHGGQVVRPFLGGLYGGDQGWFPEYVHGMYQKDNILLFETSGLGSDKQKLPRFHNPPEVAVLTIK